MIKNIIFDFGNVLTRFYADELSAYQVADEAERKTVAEVVFDRLYWDRLDKGAITDDEVKDGIRTRLPDELTEKACAVYDNWVKNLVPVENMEQVVRDLSKAGVKLYLLSNISNKFASEYADVPWIKDLFSYFEGIVLSAPIGLIKPDVEIFEYILNKYDLKIEDCLFVDDTLINIEGAQKAGIQTYHFDGDAEKFRKYLGI